MRLIRKCVFYILTLGVFVLKEVMYKTHMTYVTFTTKPKEPADPRVEYLIEQLSACENGLDIFAIEDRKSLLRQFHQRLITDGVLPTGHLSYQTSNLKPNGSFDHVKFVLKGKFKHIFKQALKTHPKASVNYIRDTPYISTDVAAEVYANLMIGPKL